MYICTYVYIYVYMLCMHVCVWIHIYIYIYYDPHERALELSRDDALHEGLDALLSRRLDIS